MSSRRSRGGGGREASRAARTSGKAASIPYIKRNIPFFEIAKEETLELIENNAETILRGSRH